MLTAYEAYILRWELRFMTIVATTYGTNTRSATNTDTKATRAERDKRAKEAEATGSTQRGKTRRKGKRLRAIATVTE